MIILRFRDYDADTISEHIRILEAGGSVWWGWWRKEDEDRKLEELRGTFQSLDGSSIVIGIFDASTDRFFKAALGDLVFSTTGDRITSPDPSKTPQYYRDKKAPAWFLITSIEVISKDEFERVFGKVPVGDATLFGAESSRGGHRDVPITETRLQSSRILHLSDLHFGCDFGYPAVSGPGERTLLEILSEDVKEQCPEGIGLVIVSGDLTSQADANVLFDPVLPFLEKLAETLGLPPAQVVIVPGNHDIPLDNYSHLTYEHEAAFNAFQKQFYGDLPLWPRLHRFITPRGRVLEILPMNSVRLRAPELKNIGYTNWRLYAELLRQCAPEEGTLRVAVLHHHLVPASNEETLHRDYAQAGLSVTWDAGAVIEGLQRNGFRLVLHGHQHVPRLTRVGRGRTDDDSTELYGFDEPLYVLAAGSAGVKSERLSPELPANTYGLLDVKDAEVRAEVRRFTTAGRSAREFTTILGI